jgi:hypothetical protein
MRMKWIGLAAFAALVALALTFGDASSATPGATSSRKPAATAKAKPSTTTKKTPTKKRAKKNLVSWRALKPTKTDGKACVRIGASESSYYRLDTKKSIEFVVHGPTQVKLITRHLPVKKKIGRRSYTLQVDRDGTSVLKKKQSAPRATRGQLCTSKKQRVGASRTVILRVPEGRHVYRLGVTQPGKGVAVRILEQAKTRQGTRTGFKPDEYDRTCRLSLGNGKTYLHYHATAAKPLRFRVTGPTQLLVRSRLDLAVGGPAEERYRIEVRRDNLPAGIYSYKTRQLAKGAYQDCPQIVPSEDRRLYLSVPKGTWTYELRPADATTPGFMARILIPRTAVGMSGRAAR